MSLSSFLETATILDIQKALDKRRFSSYDLVIFYLERMAAHDSSGAKINSVLELNPDAVFIAQALDQERDRQGP
ncbi:MAG: amidase, partial [Firmicutes bacterium]|nr:amidase [Bacillota bacterium]